MRRVEAVSFVAHTHGQAGRTLDFERREFDVDALGFVSGVAMLDGVDDRLADGDAQPVHRVVVQADQAADVIAHHLYEIQHLERAAEIEANRRGPCAHRRRRLRIAAVDRQDVAARRGRESDISDFERSPVAPSGRSMVSWYCSVCFRCRTAIAAPISGSSVISRVVADPAIGS